MKNMYTTKFGEINDEMRMRIMILFKDNFVLYIFLDQITLYALLPLPMPPCPFFPGTATATYLGPQA